MAAVEVLKTFFVNRTDCYCIQRKKGYIRIDQPLTDAVLEQHLKGHITVGSYQLDRVSRVKWLCFDFDPEKLANPQEAVKEVLNVLFEEEEEADGINRPRVWPHSILLEASRYPDPSYHVWILFLISVSAKATQWLGYRILELANLNPKQVEIFPKQAELTQDRPFGNFVKLPLGFHQVEQKWSRILNNVTFEPLASLKIQELRGITFSEADLTKMASFEVKRHVQTSFSLPKKFKPLSDREEEKVVQFLCKYWREGYRNRLEMYFLGLCLKKGVSFESAERIISEVADRTNDSEKQARLDLAVYHYRSRLTVSLKGSSGLREIIGEME
jgi:hypothetical protein